MDMDKKDLFDLKKKVDIKKYQEKLYESLYSMLLKKT
jgi:hypothetical protein